MKRFAALLLALSLSINLAFAADQLDNSIRDLQHAWARANYKTPKDGQEAAFKALSEQAHQVSAANPGRAEPLIWEAIILSGYANAKGGLGALKLAEQARDLLLGAEKLNPLALDGSAYTTLGSLYYKVPGWPIGFGDKKKSRTYLEKALMLNPEGIDPNYFYADFLLEQKDYARAADYFHKALEAAPRPGREDADEGRRADIREGLRQAERKS